MASMPLTIGCISCGDAAWLFPRDDLEVHSTEYSRLASGSVVRKEKDMRQASIMAKRKPKNSPGEKLAGLLSLIHAVQF